MANPYFRFKQFTIRHDKCAMKVGTDGVLLGAWASTANAGRILDVGTGSGLIALMLAQRSNALIDAIDIDKGAYIQAMENVAESPFAHNINVYHTSLADFARENPARYNLIVSNPPYFANSLKNPDESRAQARHNDSLMPEDLFAHAKHLLSACGRIAIVMPFDQLARFIQAAESNSLYASHITKVYPTPGSSPKRALLAVSAAEPGTIREDELVIETARHQYTEEYINLTRDYYLKM